LVTAGGGGGKTEFLAQKATYLLETGLCASPHRILAISFKRDAASNLAERVRLRCSTTQVRRFNSYTFDSFAKTVVDRFRAAIPAPYRPCADYRIIIPSRQDYTAFLDSQDIHSVNVQQLERAIATARLPIPNAGSNLQRAVATYWEMHCIEGDSQVTFAMLNRLAEFLLRENVLLLKALRRTYPIVFLDEFQDTTLSQFQLLTTAFDRSGAIFTAVGDDKQRIMEWAGAMPDAFAKFEASFAARRVSLLFNWRSHEELVRVQHIIARAIDSQAEQPLARADRQVDGDVSAIWEFASEEEEASCLARWIAHEIEGGAIAAHDFAILCRQRVNEVDSCLAPAFDSVGVRLRNVARVVGEIAIQDLLSEELTQVFVRLLRLGAAIRSPDSWNGAVHDLQHLEGVSLEDEEALQRLHRRLQVFTRTLRCMLSHLPVVPDSAAEVIQAVLDFIGESTLRSAFSAYRRQADFQRVLGGFLLLLRECLERAGSWPEALDEFEGRQQVSLMTIHKSKGLEFHTMIFYGLDDKTWWSLKPRNREEVSSFFVAFTRAKQRAFFSLCTERGGPVTWIEEMLAKTSLRRVAFSNVYGEC
jgi:superfamily I DNA/RNA helicase